MNKKKKKHSSGGQTAAKEGGSTDAVESTQTADDAADAEQAAEE